MMNNERYFAYLVPSIDGQVNTLYRKLRKSNTTYFGNNETLITLEKDDKSNNKSLILCKVSIEEIKYNNSENDNSYSEFLKNNDININDFDKKKIYGNEKIEEQNNKTYAYYFEYLIFNDSRFYNRKPHKFCKSFDEYIEHIKKYNVSETEKNLMKLTLLLHLFHPINNDFLGTKFDAFDLMNKSRLLNYISPQNDIHKFLKYFEITENMIADIWKSIFGYGINLYNESYNNLSNSQNVNYSIFDVAMENYHMFSKIAGGWDIIPESKMGIKTENTINAFEITNLNIKYQLATSYYYKNELSELKFTDIIGYLVARKHITHKINYDFKCVSTNHYFPNWSYIEYKTNRNHYYPIAVCNLVNRLIINMGYKTTPFKYEFVKSNNNDLNLGYKLFIHKEYVNRLFYENTSNIIENKKTLFEIYALNGIKYDCIIPEKLYYIYDTTETGKYWPSLKIDEFANVNTGINAKLFSYQKRNITWMHNVENSIKNGTYRCNFENLGLLEYLSDKNKVINNHVLSNVNFNNTLSKYIIFKGTTVDPVYSILYPNNINKNIELTGGIIADDVGLGKTLTVISHLVNQYENDMNDYLDMQFDCNNLIIIPPRLMKQWVFEIEKYVPDKRFNIITLSTISDIKKFSSSRTNTKTNYVKNSPSTAINNKQDVFNQENVLDSNNSYINRGPFKIPQNTTSNNKLLLSQLIDDIIEYKNITLPNTETNATINVSNSDNVENSCIDNNLEKKNNSKRSKNQKLDIVILSLNLLKNPKYYEYLDDSYKATNYNNDYDLDRNEYLDLFRIKWNRIIIDEAHECIKSPNYCTSVSPENTIIPSIIIHRLNSRYRWALTATPFEDNINNIIGYLLWFLKSSKHYITNIDKSTKNKLLLNSNEIDSRNTYKLFSIIHKNIDYLVSLEEFVNFQKCVLTKTSKCSIATEIDIPIFTEQINYIDLGQIERNIYNNAKTDTNYKGNRLRRLFELCTNICISKDDMQNMGFNNVMSLDDLNKAMVCNFTKQLNEVECDINELNKELPLCDLKKTVSAKILEDIVNLEPRLENKNLANNNRIRKMIEYALSYEDNNYGYHNGYNNGFNNNDKLILKTIRKILYARLLECTECSEAIIGITIEIMDSFNVNRPNWDEYQVLYTIYHFLCSFSNKSAKHRKTIEENIAKLEREKIRLGNQIKLFENNDFIKEKTDDPCSICWSDYELDSQIVVTNCRHVYCGECFTALSKNKTIISCPECRDDVNVKSVKITTMRELSSPDADTDNGKNTIINDEKNETNTDNIIPEWKSECISKYGTKMANLVEILNDLFKTGNNRAIVFSQYDMMLKLIGETLNKYGIKNVYARGNVHVINKNIDTFKRDESIRVIMLSSEHANSGCNLTEASHIILVDVLNMDKVKTKQVETQAIGRAVRLGQKKPVKVIRLITRDTIEEEYYNKHKYDIAEIQ